MQTSFFITGTDTNVGKTFISAILVAGLRGYYFKPIQTGSKDLIDSQWIKEQTGLKEKHFLPETYLFKEPLSPHLAARLEKDFIDLEKIPLPEQRPLLVEGAGGILVPLNQKQFMLDLMQKFNLPLILVARSTLGTINHTLLSLEVLRSRKLKIAGVVLNGPLHPENKEAIEYYGKVKVIAQIPWLEDTKIDYFNLYQTYFQDLKGVFS